MRRSPRTTTRRRSRAPMCCRADRYRRGFEPGGGAYAWPSLSARCGLRGWKGPSAPVGRQNRFGVRASTRADLKLFQPERFRRLYPGDIVGVSARRALGGGVVQTPVRICTVRVQPPVRAQSDRGAPHRLGVVVALEAAHDEVTGPVFTIAPPAAPVDRQRLRHRRLRHHGAARDDVRQHRRRRHAHVVTRMTRSGHAGVHALRLGLTRGRRGRPRQPRKAPQASSVHVERAEDGDDVVRTAGACRPPRSARRGSRRRSRSGDDLSSSSSEVRVPALL